MPNLITVPSADLTAITPETLIDLVLANKWPFLGLGALVILGLLSLLAFRVKPTPLEEIAESIPKSALNRPSELPDPLPPMQNTPPAMQDSPPTPSDPFTASEALPTKGIMI